MAGFWVGYFYVLMEKNRFHSRVCNLDSPLTADCSLLIPCCEPASNRENNKNAAAQTAEATARPMTSQMSENPVFHGRVNTYKNHTKIIKTRRYITPWRHWTLNNRICGGLQSGVYSLGATRFGPGSPLTRLGVYSLGVYSLGATRFGPGTALTRLGVYSLGVYSLQSGGLQPGGLQLSLLHI